MSNIKRYYEEVADVRAHAYILFGTPLMAQAEAAGDEEISCIEFKAGVELRVCAGRYRCDKPMTFTYEVWEGRGRVRRSEKFKKVSAAFTYLSELLGVEQEGLLGRAHNLFSTAAY